MLSFVASSCYTCNRAIWLIGLFICNWNTVYIPKNKAPGTSPWIHFLNQSSLWPPLSHRFPLTEDFTAFGPYNGHGVEAAAAAGGADRLKLTNVIPDLLLSHTSTKPSGRPWPAPSLYAQLRICEKNFVADHAQSLQETEHDLPRISSRRCAAVLFGRVTRSKLWLNMLPNVKLWRLLGRVTRSKLWLKLLPNVKLWRLLGRVTSSRLCQALKTAWQGHFVWALVKYAAKCQALKTAWQGHSFQAVVKASAKCQALKAAWQGH